MRRLPFIFTLLVILTTSVVSITSCKESEDSFNDIYATWGLANDEWLLRQADSVVDGEKWYTPIKPEWLPSSGVLIHYYNDRSLTEGNLSPRSNSKVTVKYVGRLYNNVPFDSSFSDVDSCRTFTLGQDLIMGWRIALPEMRVGDSADVVIPWQQAYGMTGNIGIPAFSNLKFSIKLVDIPAYEKR